MPVVLDGSGGGVPVLSVAVAGPVSERLGEVVGRVGDGGVDTTVEGSVDGGYPSVDGCSAAGLRSINVADAGAPANRLVERVVDAEGSRLGMERVR